jgi:acid phosphatase (class A)
MRKALLLHVLIALQMLASPAFPQDFAYLSKHDVDLTMLLAPAPDPKSEQQQRDLAAVLDAQQTRTPPQIERAVADNALSIFRFDDVLGPAFTAERLPVTTTFFKRAQSDSRLVILAGKEAWDRPRPFLVSAEVHFVGEKPATVGSYPSGHSTFGYLTAILLAGMLPEKSAALYARGAEFGVNRVLAGVHFPSDVEAGRISATVIAAALMRSPAFQTEFAAAKIELRRVLGL